MSFTAGAFVCNDVFYTLMRRFPAALPRGFIHVPPGEALSADRCAAALAACAEVCIRECGAGG